MSEDGEDDQVGEDEGDHAAEADAAVPEDGGKRHVADRTDELMIATTGPMIGPQSAAATSLSARNSACQEDPAPRLPEHR
jgi:hypothetical protein